MIFKYEKSRNPYKNVKLHHALNGGEKVIEGFSIDGYLELPSQGAHLPFRIGFEYLGCRYHQCEWGCIESVQTKEEIVSDRRRLEFLSNNLDELKLMRGCQWHKIRKTVNYEAELSKFIGKDIITQDLLINAVRQVVVYMT
jgi:hypothetical protein